MCAVMSHRQGITLQCHCGASFMAMLSPFVQMAPWLSIKKWVPCHRAVSQKLLFFHRRREQARHLVRVVSLVKNSVLSVGLASSTGRFRVCRLIQRTLSSLLCRVVRRQCVVILAEGQLTVRLAVLKTGAVVHSRVLETQEHQDWILSRRLLCVWPCLLLQCIGILQVARGRSRAKWG